MGYYTRVLTTRADCIPVRELQRALSEGGYGGVIEAETGDQDDWSEIVLRNADGIEIAAIERNPVGEDTLGGEEIEELRDEIANAEPQSAVEWLRHFFPRVKCIYAFQHLSGTEKDAGFEMLQAVRNVIWASGSAILQADGEGFSNEAGYHILWQFDQSATGPWWMGLLKDGKWVHFEMDLGNKRHRDAFRKGQIPEGVRYEQ